MTIYLKELYLRITLDNNYIDGNGFTDSKVSSFDLYIICLLFSVSRLRQLTGYEFLLRWKGNWGLLRGSGNVMPNVPRMHNRTT